MTYRTSTCPVCQNDFQARFKGVLGWQQFCSRKCMANVKTTKVCATCGKDYEQSKTGPKSPYCSLGCHPRPPCILCGETIYGRRAFKSGARRFCSLRCHRIFIRMLSAKVVYAGMGFIATARRIGKIACERCEFDGEDALEIHHRDRNRTNNIPANLETLCANCHRIEHRWEQPRRYRRRALDAARFLLERSSPAIWQAVDEAVERGLSRPKAYARGNAGTKKVPAIPRNRKVNNHNGPLST